MPLVEVQEFPVPAGGLALKAWTDLGTFRVVNLSGPWS